MATDADFLAYETVPLTSAATSQSVTWILPGSKRDQHNVRVYNAGPNDAFVTFGDINLGPVTASQPSAAKPGTTKVLPIKAGDTAIFRKNFTAGGSDTCAAISPAGATQLYFTSGNLAT